MWARSGGLFGSGEGGRTMWVRSGGLFGSGEGGDDYLGKVRRIIWVR